MEKKPITQAEVIDLFKKAGWYEWESHYFTDCVTLRKVIDEEYRFVFVHDDYFTHNYSNLWFHIKFVDVCNAWVGDDCNDIFFRLGDDSSVVGL